MDILSRRILIAAMSVLLVVIAVSLLMIMSDGKTLFIEQKCVTCHRFRGDGGMAGPDLSEIKSRKGTFWLINQIKDPKSHNPDSRMPPYGHLGYLKITALVCYLKS